MVEPEPTRRSRGGWVELGRVAGQELFAEDVSALLTWARAKAAPPIPPPSQTRSFVSRVRTGAHSIEYEYDKYICYLYYNIGYFMAICSLNGHFKPTL